MEPQVEFVKKHTGLDILNEKKTLLSSDIIDNYITDLKKDEDILGRIHRCEINLKNINLSLVNTLRRIILSYIPIVAIGNIKINTNNTSLINEFIEQRLSLISVSMQNDKQVYNIREDKNLNSLLLKSTYNKNLGIREYDFQNHESVPKLSLKNSHSVAKYITSDNITNDKNLKLFKKDMFSNDYQIITKLKENEEIDINMGLTVGIGFTNTIYSPVGTVSVKPVYINKIEHIEALLLNLTGEDEKSLKLRDNLLKEKEMYEGAYNSYINSIIKERKEKDLIEEGDMNPFDEEEKNNIKHDFDTLIRPRIYPYNYRGKSTNYIINIETNDNLRSEQIFLDALTVLYLSIRDLKSNIKANKMISYKETECIKISMNQKNVQDYELIIDNENHTLGNLILDYLNIYNDYIHENKFDFISYSQPHPLKNKIMFKFTTRLGSSNIFSVLNQVFDNIITDISQLGSQYLSILKSEFNYREVELINPADFPEFTNYASFRIE